MQDTGTQKNNEATKMDINAKPAKRLVVLLSRYPRFFSLALGLALTVLLLGLIEWVCRMELERRRIVQSRMPRQAHEKIADYHPMLEFHPLLGFQARAGIFPSYYFGDGRLIKKLDYHIDGFHRRQTPNQDDSSRASAVLFFGCSFTFGEGLEEDETLPAQFSRGTPGWRAFNYALIGYGPQDTYELAGFERMEELGGAIPEAAVYTYIDNHINRATAPLSMMGSHWVSHLPCVEFDGDKLVNRGRFMDARPWHHQLALFVESSATLTLMHVDWPPRLRPCDFDLTARLLIEAKNRLKAKYPGIRFHVVFYPGVTTGGEIGKRLAGQDISVLDYSRLFDGISNEPPLTFVNNHPSARAITIVADQLVEDVFSNR